jgi:regulator of protease activity HflC (stomatin/prohibitin superfamily)
MLNYFKGQPTEYVIKYSAGRIAREGPGLAFYYLPYKTQVVAVPTSSQDAGFVFNERSKNFQDVTIQGQFTYRIADPKRIAQLLNFGIYPRTRKYLSDDPERVALRIRNIVQTETRTEVQQRTLEQVLADSDAIADTVLNRIAKEKMLDSMGVELLSVNILNIAPTPEVAKALEAEYREGLLRKADEAIYARRAAAVEEERTIKEKELNTEITLEQQRRQLINLEGENAQQEAENRGKALLQETEYKARAVEREGASRAKSLEMELAPYRTMDPRTLLALGLQEIGRNAERIGNLTITPDVLAEILNLRQSGGAEQ